MIAFLESNLGIALALFGASLAAAMCCVGSAKGTGIVGEAAAGLLSHSPEHFSKCLILQVLPGTQGLYGIVAWFFTLYTIGAFSGGIVPLTVEQGLRILAACVPIGFGGGLSAIAQGKVAVASVNIVAKQPASWTQGIFMCGVVEFYAILSLLASIMMLMNAL